MGPRLIDTEHTPEPDSDSDSNADSDSGPDAEPHNGASDPPPSEETGLLRGSRPAVPDILHSPFGDHRSFFPSTRNPSATKPAPSRRRSPFFPRKHWARLGPRTRWWLLFLADFLNAPLAGALLGALIGFVPALHGAFFDDRGVLTAWLTASLRTVGSLFVPLPVVVAGTSLYAAHRGGGGGLPWGTVAYVMVVRFVAWPAAAVGVVYLLASRTGVLGSDPMLWFAMMLMPW